MDSQLFEDELKDKDIKAAIACGSNKYRKYMTYDEVRSCELVGLFNAIYVYKHDPAKSKKTTWIQNHVRFECLKFLKQEEKYNNKTELLNENYVKSRKEQNFIDFDYDGVDLELLKDYYLGGYTGKELSLKYKLSISIIFRRIKNSLKTLYRELNGV